MHRKSTEPALDPCCLTCLKPFRPKYAAQKYCCRKCAGPAVGNTHRGIPRSPETRAKIAAANTGKSHPVPPFTPEHRAKIAAALRGKPKPSVPMAPATKEKIAAANRGKPKSPEHRAKLAVSHLGKPLSPEHRAKMGRPGARNPAWKGGKARRIGRWNDPQYVAWQAAVLERDGNTCQRCGHSSPRRLGLHAHHIKPWASDPELRYAVENGATLCADCHLRTGLHRPGAEHWTNQQPERVRGEANGRARLTAEQVRAIRSRYVPRQVTGPMLAAEFDCSVPTIQDIVRRRTWADLE